MTMLDKEINFLKGNIKLIITEWIPFGTNNLHLLSEKISLAGQKGAMFTGVIDVEPTTQIFPLSEPETYIKVADYKIGEYIEFIGDLRYKSTGGDFQKELIATHVNSSGCIAYGIKLIDKTNDGFSLDALSRIICDIIIDSSTMIETVLNNYQKKILDIVFLGEEIEREKFAIITAEEIVSHHDLEDITTENSEYISEINQILMNIKSEYSINAEGSDKLFCGELGIILISKDADKYERMLYFYGLLKSIELFQNNIASRLAMTWDNITRIREKVHEKNISIMDLQIEVNKLADEISLFEAINSHIEISAKQIRKELERKREELSTKEKNIGEKLRIDNNIANIINRIHDTAPVIKSLSKEINGLKAVVSSMSEKETTLIFEAQKQLSAQSVAIGEGLEILEIILFGIYMVEVVDLIIILGGIEHALTHHYFLGMTIGLWIILIVGIIGILSGRYLIKTVKSNVFKKSLTRNSNI